MPLTLPKTKAWVHLQPPSFNDQARTDFELAIPRIRRALNNLAGASSVQRDGDSFQLYLGDDVPVSVLARQLRSTVADRLGDLAGRTGLHVFVRRGQHGGGPDYRYTPAATNDDLPETCQLG